MSWSTRTVLTLAIVAVFATVLGPSGGASRGRATTALDHRGGTLKLLAKSASGTIDPQVNYTLPYWQLYQASYDGLLAFKKAGGNAAFQVVPDIAQSIPTPTNGGKRWVFKIRKGIKFSNGQTVTPNDVAASFRRIFKVKSPTSGTFYAGIVGAQACLATPGDLHAERRRDRQRQGGHGHDQPRRTRPGVQVPPLRAARKHPPGEHAAEGRGARSPSRARAPTTSPRTSRTSS